MLSQSHWDASEIGPLLSEEHIEIIGACAMELHDQTMPREDRSTDDGNGTHADADADAPGVGSGSGLVPSVEEWRAAGEGSLMQMWGFSAHSDSDSDSNAGAGTSG